MILTIKVFAFLITMNQQHHISNKILDLFPDIKYPLEFSSVNGGSVNESFSIRYGSRQLFCKTNSATKFPHLFETEKKGLELIAKQKIIATPEVMACFEREGHQYLLLEWVSAGKPSKEFWHSFGEQLAALHQVKNIHFGLDHENYMGCVTQVNSKSVNWIDFFREQRLEPLVRLCSSNGLISADQIKLFETLYNRLPDLFNEDEPPSLVHGDLWSGNFICNQEGQPVLIDPAVYFGHRSVDLAMTTLFGGFNLPFYEAYHYHYPFPDNYKMQWPVCNLYPLLIHVFLFGRAYLSQVDDILKRFR